MTRHDLRSPLRGHTIRSIKRTFGELMNESKKNKLKSKGWSIGTVAEFFNDIMKHECQSDGICRAMDTIIKKEAVKRYRVRNAETGEELYTLTSDSSVPFEILGTYDQNGKYVHCIIETL